MVFGSFFKTSFEKGLASHEIVVKSLQGLGVKSRSNYWPFYYGVSDSSALPRRAGTALSTRMKLPGKDRRFCLPTSAMAARDIRKATAISESSSEDEGFQIVVIASGGETYASASAFTDSFEINSDILAKEVMHRLSAPRSVKKDSYLFAHDGAFGSGSTDNIKFSVVTDDPAAALYLKHMVNVTPQVDAVDFQNMFTVFHVPEYQPMDAKIIEEFSGVSADLGVSKFACFNLEERTVYVSGSTRALRDAIVCMASLIAFHEDGSLTLKCDSTIDDQGKPVLIFGGKDTLASPTLYGAHHHLWSTSGISRAWNGVTSTAPNAAKYAVDLVEKTPQATYTTSPLPLQVGGSARARGSNEPIGATPQAVEAMSYVGKGFEKLQVDDKLPFRPNEFPANGATFMFVGGANRTLTIDEAAKMFADTHASYPLGVSSKKDLEAKFKELAGNANITFKAVASA